MLVSQHLVVVLYATILGISALSLRGPYRRQITLKDGCSTNAECIRRGLPLKKPEKLKSRNRSHNQLVTRGTTVSFGYTGSLQYWYVPAGASGKWTVTAMGAAGGPVPKSCSTGSTCPPIYGAGGSLTATLTLTEGMNYTIVVGGQPPTAGSGSATSGGGGTFVYPTFGTNPDPLIIASGAGGDNNPGGGSYAGMNARGIIANDPGTGGSSGGDATYGNPTGAGGAGWNGNGASGKTSTGFATNNGGKSRNDATPWAGGGSGGSSNPGGYGGGGLRGTFSGGGGGGYSGGNGGTGDGTTGQPGQGGTSFVNTLLIYGGSTFVANNAGAGSVTFTYTG